jgi:hypothetical protein
MIVAAVGSLAQLINLTVLGQAIRLPSPGGIARFPGWQICQSMTSLLGSRRYD